MGMLYLFENNTGTRVLLAVSVTIPLMFAALAAFGKKGLKVFLTAPEQAVKGGAFKAELYINCPFPFVTVSGALQCRNLLTGEQTEQGFSIEGGGKKGKTICFSVETTHCGTLVLNADIYVQDLVGLYRTRINSDISASVLVQPNMFMPRIELVEDSGGADGDTYSPNKPGSDPSETFSIREYIPGDPVKQIHWKLSQKTGTVMMRELGLPVSNRVLLVFDAAYPTAQERSFADTVDAMAEIFFSMSRAMMLEGIGHTVCWAPEGISEPVYQTVEGEQDLMVLQESFFSAPVSRENIISPDGAGERFTHTALIASGFPVNGMLSGFGDRVTVLARETANVMSLGYYAVPFSAENYKSELYQIEI